MYYEDTYEENKILIISLTNSVKLRIKEKFNSDVEDFIEKEFPQDKELKVKIFKYGNKKKYKVAIKVEDSDFMLLIERSIDNHNDKKDNYLFCFDIQKRPEITFDENNDYLELESELKIPESFNRRYHNESTKGLLDNIEEQFENLELYKTPSLDENQEFQKWYVYLTLLEKLIDAKDFIIETDISYSKDKATVEIDDNEMFKKFIKARGEDFIFYYPEKGN